MGRVVHGTIIPPRLIHDVQTAVYNEGVHSSSLGAEACGTITARFRSAEFELEEGRVAGIDYRKVV